MEGETEGERMKEREIEGERVKKRETEGERKKEREKEGERMKERDTEGERKKERETCHSLTLYGRQMSLNNSEMPTNFRCSLTVTADSISILLFCPSVYGVWLLDR